MGSDIRLRFAPSPTGWLHVGNARTAIYNWLQAQREDGVLILRIEDTDRVRSRRDFEQAILEDLTWLGVHWQEGPDRGGSSGPYRQSEREKIYLEYAQRLLSTGKAYPCYCTDEDLAVRRAEARALRRPPRYDGRCRGLSAAQRRKLEAQGIRPSIRFRADEEVITVTDQIRGMVSFPSGFVGDFVIIRSDGLPTYNFAAVVDDALMGITDVIRGEDHLSNTPRQIMLYRAMGFPVPRFAHHALLLGPDGHRLSKRHGATAVRLYREEGFLPQTLFNYLALLGWAIEGGAEVMDPAELVRHFDIKKVRAGSAVFDMDKLLWLNSQHMHFLSPEELAHHMQPFLEKAGLDTGSVDVSYLTAMAGAIRDNIQTLSQAAVPSAIFLKTPDLDEEAIKVLTLPGAREVLQAFRQEAERLCASSRLDPAALISAAMSRTGLKGKQLFMPLRAALTGSIRGPELQAVLGLLTREEIIRRLERALASL
ncbi:MAG: glutamate--tRNA ligase [Deltaproteobacteria bacterium]|nr:glutamate--tRNA ligase [Deltaproteobacteria bacterium]MBW2305722.1 glutamate--tRNA ligase [Deltaproteobacteria bacterium]